MEKYIIAEIGVNHNGSLKRAKEMIKQSKLSGVDAVKFQTYKAENIADSKVSKAHYQKIDNKHESQYEMLKKYELSDEDFKELYEYTIKNDIDFISTAADEKALEFLHNRLNLKTIKIGSSDLSNIQLLINAGRTKKNIIISLGGGGFLNKNIRKEILINHTSIWLNWDNQTIIDRIKNSKKRPLTFNLSKDDLDQLIKKRSFTYSKSLHKINCNHLSKNEVVNKVLKIYEN